MNFSPAFEGIGRRDLRAIAFLAAPLALLFLPLLLGRTLFWGDLLYLHHPWRALPAEMLQRGVLPLWNPFVYLGMPLAGEMQCAAWYPGTIPFYLFPFSSALPLYHAVHFFLVSFFSFLWLRRLGLNRWAAVGAAAAAALGGPLVSRLPFLNHLSTLAFLPALMLFSPSPVLIGLCLALAFFGGYPPTLAGTAAAACLVSYAAPRILRARTDSKRHLAGWLAGGLLSAGLAAALLLPASRLAADSRRGGGIEPAESLTWSFEPRDLVQFTAPTLIPGDEFSPTVNWWKTAYWGFFGIAAAGAGLCSLPLAAGAVAGGYLGTVSLLILGGTNPISRWIWETLPALRFVRYPGNMAYLAIPAFALLIALGLHRRRWAGWVALAITVELAAYALTTHPTAPADFFTRPGPLVPLLRKELSGARYLISPLALNWHRGRGITGDEAAADLRHRLYGLTNAPYHLSAIGNFGEPLVPKRAYGFMDFLYRLPGPDAVAPWLPWAGARVLMTRDKIPAAGLDYIGGGGNIWHLYASRGPSSRALWFPLGPGAAIPAEARGAPPDAGAGIPLAVERSREDRFAVAARRDAPGWVYLAETLGPGWTARLNGRPAPLVPALGAFWKVPVPAGEWALTFKYAPRPWAAGRAVTLLFLAALSTLAAVRLGRVGRFQ